jgi:hypothetical protein
MKAEIIGDKMLDQFERFMESPWCDRVCLAIIGLAALYFTPMCIRAFLR